MIDDAERVDCASVEQIPHQHVGLGRHLDSAVDGCPYQRLCLIVTGKEQSGHLSLPGCLAVVGPPLVERMTRSVFLIDRISRRARDCSWCGGLAFQPSQEFTRTALSGIVSTAQQVESAARQRQFREGRHKTALQKVFFYEGEGRNYGAQSCERRFKRKRQIIENRPLWGIVGALTVAFEPALPFIGCRSRLKQRQLIEVGWPSEAVVVSQL